MLSMYLPQTRTPTPTHLTEDFLENICESAREEEGGFEHAVARRLLIACKKVNSRTTTNPPFLHEAAL